METMTMFSSAVRPRRNFLLRGYAIVTVKNRLIAVPQMVMNTEFPKARISLLEAKIYL